MKPIFGELDIEFKGGNFEGLPYWRVLIRSKVGLAHGIFQSEAERDGFVTGFRMAAEKADAAKVEVKA